MKNLIICDNTKLAETSKYCLDHGLGIEVQSFYDPDYINRERNSLKIHNKAMENIEVRSFHGPFGDLSPGSFDDLVRDVARLRFDFAVTTAEKLGIESIVLHHGYYPKTSPTALWIKRSILFWQNFLNEQSKDIRIHLENVYEKDPSMMIELIDAVDDPRLDICLDIGHVNCNAETGLTDWIERLGERIGYYHIHDNHGMLDEHLPLGSGTIEVDQFFAAVKEFTPNAVLALESDVSSLDKVIDMIQSYY